MGITSSQKKGSDHPEGEKEREWDMMFLVVPSGGGVCTASIMMVLMVVHGDQLGQGRECHF